MKYQKPILMSIFLAYTASWSYITVMKFFAMNTNVFDLGLFMEYGWIVLHQVHTVSSFFYWFSYNGIIYVVSPITQLDSYPAVLVFQSAFIGFAVFPLFGVARHYLHDDVSALLISASYLVYFPLVGVNWFDAHYQALFPTLFLLGYYFYTKERLAPSAVFFILSSMVRYPYFIFAFLFALIVLGGQLLKRRNMDARKVWFSLIIIAFGLFITALFYLFYSHGAFATNALGTVRLSSAGTNISEAKFETLVLFFLPLLFLPLLSRKWVIFYVPFFYLVFATNFWGYLYPNVFALQYPAGIVPFLFLGTIDGVVLIGRSRKRAVSAMVLIAVVAFALAYEPYGPLNGSSGIDYNFKQQISANMGLYNEMNRVISLINKTDPYVLFQSNIPQVLPRPLQYVRTPLITNLQEVTYNFMHIYPNGTSVPVRVDYVLSDPYSGWYYFNQAPPYNASMYDFVRELYNSTDYGLLAEASGIMLLERNYTGSVKYFAPLDNSFSTSQMLSAGLQKGDLFNYTNLDNKNFKIEWYGPYATLYPGTYTATYWLYTTSNSSPILLQVTAEGGTVTLVSKMLEPGTLKQGEWNRVNLTFYSDGILTGAEFRGLIAGYSGTLLFGGVNLTQVGPGLPNSHDYYVFPDQLSTRGALRNDEITVSNASNEIAWYGPYLTLQPGHYIVRYELSTTNTSPYNRAMMQVTADSGKVVLGEQGITGSDTNMANVELYLNSTEQNVEFRGIVQNWPGNLTVKGIEVLSTSGAVNETYSAYGLYSEFYVNGTAQGSWYGPYTTLGPGNYSVTFVTNGKGTVNLQVTSDYGNKYIVTQTVSVPGTYTLNFSLKTEEQYVEFRGFAVNGNVQLVKIKVTGGPS